MKTTEGNSQSGYQADSDETRFESYAIWPGLDAWHAENFRTSGTRWSDSGSSSGGTSTPLGSSAGVVAWSLAGAGVTDATGQLFSGSSVNPGSVFGFDYLSTLRSAFDAWATYGNIEFIQVQDGGGSIGVGTWPTIRVTTGYMDGASNVLAAAFYPASPAYGGDINFDSGETSFWTAQSFYLVAVHEIGHALGLAHEPTNLAIMNAYYNPSLTGLQTDDINGVRSIYGSQDFGSNIFYMPSSLANLTLIDGAPVLTVTGNASANQITGSSGAETIDGGGGNDTISGGGGNDTLFGGTGTDTVSFSWSSAAWTINLTTGSMSGSAGSGGLIAFENVIGGSGNDVLVVGAGMNTLTGGAGQDAFIYYPGSGADTITDFVSGNGASHDILDFSMLQGTDTLSNVLALATQSGSDTIFNFGSGNTLTLQSVLKTSLVSADFNFGSAALSTTFVPPRDFDGDTHSDILWRNDNGSIKLWEWNGSAVTDLSLGSVPTNWQILDMGDFNADSRSGDLLWRNEAGIVAIWEMNGNSVIGNYGVGTLATEWQMASTGDFNGDSKSDILWRHPNGSIKLWEINTGSGNVELSLGSVPVNWQILETGDFNGDGRSGDLLWRNEAGVVAIWEMNGNSVTGNYGVGTMTTDWQFVDTGDFNGDSKSDILWRHPNGSIKLWEINTGSGNVDLSLGSVPTDWRIAGTGDFNADGKADLLWHQDSTGITAGWEMNGNSVIGNHGFGTLSTDWHILA